MIYFSDYFLVDRKSVEDYGAIDICLISDLPLFIDPFLLFNSAKEEYQNLHAGIIRYLEFLRDRSMSAEQVPDGLLAAWYQFKEVKQNWFGFTFLGNDGHALGPEFAKSLHANLATIFSDFGDEEITDGTHLEKLCLIKDGVGRDSISDFTTCLIKEYLLNYTETFAKRHIDPRFRRSTNVRRVRFNYDTETWQDGHYDLPFCGDDYVLLTPAELLTRDDTWINRSDMLDRIRDIPFAIPDRELRAQISNYFEKALRLNTAIGKSPTKRDEHSAAAATVAKYPELIDYYLQTKEEEGEQAQAESQVRVDDTRAVFIRRLQLLLQDLERTDIPQMPFDSYDACLRRAKAFKHYVEHNDGYRLINRGNGKTFSQESEVQLYFGIMWHESLFDVNREVNNGRGPVDFKVSFGSIDKSLIEFKLGSNTQLRRNLEKQLPVYEAANKTKKSVKVIVCYTAQQQTRTEKILRELKIAEQENIIVIDARSDNKPSGSKA